MAACEPAGPPAEKEPGWQAMPGSPLSPREAALGLWTGREALLIGGSDTSPCLPARSRLPAGSHTAG